MGAPKGNKNRVAHYHTQETKDKISDAHRGKKLSPETRKRMGDAQRGIKNCNYGKHPSDETRKKMSIAAKQKPPMTEETRFKLSVASMGRHHTEEAKKKISVGNKGKPKSEDHRKKISDMVRNPSAETRAKMRASHTGVPLSETHRKNLIAATVGKHIISPEACMRMSVARKGSLNPQWKGGISFEPYCQKFNNEFKERVRSFFNHACVECGQTQTTYQLHVHHVNFNKQSCCDNTQPLFVTLCHSCHSRTNHNRAFWEYWFVEMIMRHYNSQCYLPRSDNATS